MPLKPTDPAPAARRHWLLVALAALASTVAAVLAACRSTPMPPHSPPYTPPVPDASGVTGPVDANQGSARASSASNPKAYRADAATHLYGLNAERIYKGRMPPHLYAIGVLNVELDRAGRVTKLDWLRAPKHAPEVVAEIERTVKSAAPFPTPTRLGKVVYTDTWLWHESGRFQLDTLTEGQD